MSLTLGKYNEYEKKVESQQKNSHGSSSPSTQKNQGTSPSIFDNSSSSDRTIATMTYNEWKNSLQERGLKTTNIHDHEANFSDYNNALSDDLKEDILSSFGDQEGDYELQAKLASAFTKTNYLDIKNLYAFCKANGIEVSRESVKTTYIPDNKGDGHYDRDIRHGSISVYTFTDPTTGAQIKIADSNGNGAIETEELFINEALGEVISDLEISDSYNAYSSGSNSGVSDSLFASDVNAINKANEALAEQSDNTKKGVSSSIDRMLAKADEELANAKKELLQQRAEIKAAKEAESKEEATGKKESATQTQQRAAATSSQQTENSESVESDIMATKSESAKEEEDFRNIFTIKAA